MKKLIPASVIICVSLIASPVFAQSVNASLIANLRAQINALNAQIANLQMSTQQVATTPSHGMQVSCARLSANLQKGARGPEVLELQKFLAVHFSLDSSATVTGYFGKITHANVVRYQKEVGLPPLGFVGGLTRALLVKNCATIPSPPTTPTPSNPDSGSGATPPAPPAPPAAMIDATIEVAAPGAGLTFAQGDMVTITWQTKKALVGSSIKLYLVNSVGSTTPIQATLSAESGMRSYEWAVPLSAGAGSYKIRVVLESVSGQEVVQAESASFAVTTSNIVLSVSSPGAGSAYVRGQLMPITWIATSAPNGSSVSIWVLKASGENAAEVNQKTFIDGTLYYTIPMDLTAGAYVVKVALNSGSGAEITSITKDFTLGL